MARDTRLDPTPVAKDDGPDFSESLRRLPHALKKTKSESGRATFDEYQAMVSDRPEKFTAADVNYRPAEGTERCGICFHFFRQAGGAQRVVCEIYRPREGDEALKPTGVCSFVTIDGKDFPLLEGGKNGKA